MSKQKILISLSLPKTGTTYLEALLLQLRNVSLPKIKEPSYFFSAAGNESSVLTSLLSPGNYSRGKAWYRELFRDHAGADLLVDLSTQYWLHPDQVIENALKEYEPTFILIKRSRVDQLISYISHMRRGHIGDDAIGDLYGRDVQLARYLDRMANWSMDFLFIKKKYPDIKFIEISFDDLIENPRAILREIVPGLEDAGAINLNVSKNPKSHPRLVILNRIVFSNTMRSIGRIFPQRLYSHLISLRKKIVGINLRTGEGKCFDDDKSFVIKTFR